MSSSKKMGKTMINQRKILWISLFWGALWGLAEATVGHFLHWISVPGIAGFVMFPIGLVFMVQAFKHSGKVSVIFFTALVAANVKLIDLFLPAHSLFAVTNPAVAILCESLAVMLAFSLKGSRRVLSSLSHVWGIAFIWRLVYAASTFALGSIFPIQSFTEMGSSHIFRFFLLDSLANAILILAVINTLKISPPSIIHHIRKHPAFYAIPLFIAALSLELLLK
jgi:hypothetical protein